MTLADNITAITAEISSYDLAAAHLTTTRAALVQNQTDLATLLANTALPVATRASQSALLKATAEVLQSDIASQELALAALQKQLTGEASILQSNLRAELGGKINALIATTVTSLQTDFDPQQIRYPLQQIAAAHRDVLALRTIENSLLMHRPGDVEYINWARGAQTLLSQIDS
jgi:hypothetical protein